MQNLIVPILIILYIAWLSYKPYREAKIDKKKKMRESQAKLPRFRKFD
jgi:hypothetical protein